MDSYPGDLLAGVFPLVFAVDAIAPPSQEASAEILGNESPSSSSARSLFDRFMDALAASLVDNEVNDDVSTAARSKSGSESLTSFLRGDNNESSDEDDISFMDVSSRKGGRRNSPFSHMRRHHQQTSQGPSSPSNNSSYANYHANEGFFQRARILSISTRHGFPPSKDPEGTNNRALLLSQARSTLAIATTTMNTARLQSILEQQPIDGILPAGWLEKHVHALPSALLVLTSLSAEEEQDEASDKRLLETIEHLQESLAPKRECHIHVVCLIEDMTSVSQSRIDGWFDQLRAQSRIGSSDISLLSLDDLLPSSASSPALRGLHKTVRDASLAYYLRQARRAKRKHSVLGHERQPNLLPLAARYCFKIGVFYEFQLKITKSLRYFAAAYRHVETYYRYLQGIAPEEPFLEGDVVVNPQGDETVEMALPEESMESAYEDDQTGASGVEIALSNDDEKELEEDTPALSDESKRGAPIDEIPGDMAHQCRAVADWLNLKLLQAGFLSSAYTESPEGILAASSQWRRHVQCFLARDKTNPSWNHWLYVKNQRLVMSQLVERHKPRSAEGLDEEVLVRCSPWRNYQAVAEAVLCLGADLNKQNWKKSDSAGSDKSEVANLRKRYVGGLDSEGLAPQFEEESKKDYTAVALEFILRSIALYEREVESKDPSDEEEVDQTLIRTGARLYYVAGGILLGLQRHREAIPHLEKAVKSAAGWDGLESITRRMLVNCYEMHVPEGSDSLGSHEPSFFLDAVYNADASSATVSSVIEKYAASCGGETPLEWYHSWTDDSQSSAPVLFTVSFPGGTHATAGDTTFAYITIKSNLNYPISVNSMTLLSSAEPVEVPSADLVAAEDTTVGGDGSIFIKPKAVVRLTTKINLPRDVEKIAVDESTSPEKQASSEKGASSVKSARPRTAGISSAAGARLVSEKAYGSGPGAQWSLSCLGGRALRCDGMRLNLTPADTTGVSIDLTVEKKDVPIPSFAKRTPFEHDNYVAVAWSRPLHLSLSGGPRCLRVLGPMPKMVVTNLTNPVVDGKALEGTVNRIMLKLKAGENEVCRDVKYSISCSSTVLSSKDGTTRSLTQPEGPSSPGGPELDISNMRTPVIVARTIGTGSQSTGFGFTLPKGWHVVGTGQSTKDDEALEAVPVLSSGDESYIELDLYRPSRRAVEEDDGICQTDFEVSVTYSQTRMMEGAESEADEFDVVSLIHSGSVVWTSPITSVFRLSGVEKAFPSGSRHPMNLCPRKSEKSVKPPVSLRDDGDTEIALIDGERLSAKCLVRANDSLGVHVTQLKFENWEDSSDYGEKACTFRHVSDENEDGVLYSSTGANLTGQLTKGSQFGVTYTVEANMLPEYKKGSVTAALGAINVHWSPLPILLNEGAQQLAHGPLVLEEPSVMSFRGPSCYVESAPFETVLQGPPTPPRVATPFEMCYRISNKTGVHQKLSVRMDTNSEGNKPAEEGLLVSGLVQGEIRLAPYESQILSYTALAMHAGKTMLPALTIASDRYKTWIMNGTDAGAGASRQLYVLP